MSFLKWHPVEIRCFFFFNASIPCGDKNNKTAHWLGNSWIDYSASKLWNIMQLLKTMISALSVEPDESICS